MILVSWESMILVNCKDFLKKCADVFLGSEGVDEPFSNQKLVDKIFEVYKERFEEETFEQEMLFPTCFRIYLHSKDFKSRQEAFAVISRAMANKFCAFNRTKMHKYKYNTPKSPYWLFQFVEFKEGAIVEGVDENVKIGDIHVISTLFSQDFSTNRDNISSEGRVAMTKTPKNSTNPQQLNNININAFLGMDMLDGNRFKIKIPENYEEITYTPKSDVPAYLICDKNFVNGVENEYGKKDRYYITTNNIDISGENDSRTGLPVAKVNYPLPNSIVQIKNENGKFLLAAFGKVRLSERLVPKSEGSNLHWETLSDSSRILINDEVSIDFKKT